MNGTSRSLDRALKIFGLFNEDKLEWSVSEICKELRIPPASGYRILGSLERAKFLDRSKNGTSYQLGLETIRLSHLVLAGLDIRDAARPIMRDLARKIGETIILLVPGTGMAVCIEAVEGVSPILPRPLRVGEHVPYNAGAAPLTLLAFLDPHDRDRIIASRLPKLTERTLVKSSELRARCVQIAGDGVAYSRSEMIAKTLAVAAPIFSGDGSPVAGAIALTRIG